jgi:O-antigen ligase
MLVLSTYCLYQSHTRTALIGFVLFWSIFLWGNYKRIFLIGGILVLILSFFFLGNISRLIWKKEKQADINVATSGRIGIWENYYQTFKDSSIPEKFLGRGLGWKNPGPGFHNDYLKLLLNLGIIGLILYLILLFSLLYDIYMCKERKIKYIFGGIVISLSIINFGSNTVISRFELSQYFWMIMGIYYNLDLLGKK